MGVKYKTGDITTFVGDLIVNSVGVTSTKYGGICESIVKASHSSELKKIIDDVNNVYFVGDFFITEGYALPSKNILHLVTPYCKNDKDYILFKECIRRILNECHLRRFFNIAIPLIGIGANEYDKNVVNNVIYDMCDAYCDYYNKMNITIYLAPENITLANRARIRRESYDSEQLHDPETLKKFGKSSKSFSNTFENKKKDDNYTKKYFGFEKYRRGRERMDVDTKDVRNVGDYVDTYIDSLVEYSSSKTDWQKRINLYFGYGTTAENKNYSVLGSNTYGQLKNRTDLDKNDFYKIIFALKMPKEDADDFLKFFGHAFAHKGINIRDDVVSNLLLNKRYGIVDIELEFNKIKLKSLFKKQK